MEIRALDLLNGTTLGQQSKEVENDFLGQS